MNNKWRNLLSVTLFSQLMLTSGACLAQYENDINRWTTQDALNPPSAGSILFTGSSSIRRWEQLTRDFADYKVIQRGFGGSQFDDLNRFVNDIVLPYNPEAIVVWEGTNDLAAGSDGPEVFADYQEFVSTVHAVQPNVEIIYLGIAPTPGREANRPQEDIANAQISTLAASNPKLHYIDLPTAYASLNPYGSQEFLDLFVDSIHLNRQGYDLWTSVIRPQIEAIVAPNKTFVPNPNTLQTGRRILFDFGPSNTEDGDHTTSPDANGNHWNNWHSEDGGVAINAGEHVGNLVDETGASTGIDLTITAGFLSNGKLNGGLLTPNPTLLGDLAIPTATQDYFFSTADGLQGGGSDDVGGGFMLDGLDPNLAYNIRLFGSRETTQTRNTEYKATGANTQTVTLQTSGINIGGDGIYDANDDEFAEIQMIRPDAFGQIFVDMTLVFGPFAYLNMMEVSAVVPGDFDGDTQVGLSDLNILGANWDQNVTPGTLGDANGDGHVGLPDLNLLGANWSPPSAVSLPEPAAFSVATLSTMTWLLISRAGVENDVR